MAAVYMLKYGLADDNYMVNYKRDAFLALYGKRSDAIDYAFGCLKQKLDDQFVNIRNANVDIREGVDADVVVLNVNGKDLEWFRIIKQDIL